MSCGQGTRTRYRFCSDDSFNCQVQIFLEFLSQFNYDLLQGSRVESASCSESSCPSTSPPVTLTTEIKTSAPRPTPVYGASPCECGCTYILHTSSQPGDTSSVRDINIVSGDCHVFPVTWTVKVPEHRQMLLDVANVSFSCPELQLNIRDGVEDRDTLLYTIHVDTNVSVAVRSSGHVSRLELVSDTRGLNSSSCFAVLHLGVIIKGK